MTTRLLITIVFIAHFAANCHGQLQPRIEKYAQAYDDSLNSLEFYSEFSYSISQGDAGDPQQVGTGVFAKRGKSFRHSLTFDKKFLASGPGQRSFDVASHAGIGLIHHHPDPKGLSVLASSVFRLRERFRDRFRLGYSSDDIVTPIFPLGSRSGDEFAFKGERAWLEEMTVDEKTATIHLGKRVANEVYSRRLKFDLSYDPPILTHVRRQYQRAGELKPEVTTTASLSDFVACTGGTVAKTVVMDRNVQGNSVRTVCKLTVIRRVADADFDITLAPSEIVIGVRGFPMGKKRVLNLLKIKPEQVLRVGDAVKLADTVGGQPENADIRRGAFLGVIPIRTPPRNDNEKNICKIGNPVAGSPAKLAGLVLGDTIVQVDAKVITSFGELSATISEYAPGETISVIVDRKSEKVEMEIELGKWPNH